MDDAQFVACEFCGAVYDVSEQRWFDATAMTEAFATTKAAVFWGSKAAARFARLGEQMMNASSDDTEYLARSTEYHFVYTLVYPDRLPRTVIASPKARAAWASQAAACDVVTRTDPEVAALAAEMNRSLAGFGNAHASAGEIVAAATLAVERATRLYAALQVRLPGQFPAPAAHYGRSTVRTSLLTMLAMLRDPEVYPRVATEVFGDRHGIGEDCTHCGGPLGDRDRAVERCGHCGSVLERNVDDPWIASRVALFRATLDERHRRNELDTYVTALDAFSFVGAWALAGTERVATYLRRAMPWLPAEALAFAASLYRDQLPGADRDVFDAVVALPWTADPRTRPAPPAAPRDAFDADAWLEKSCVMWRQANVTTDPVLAALSIAIIDVLVAPANARPPITAALVLQFFDAVGVPREPRAERMRIAVMGYGDGPAGDLVRAIAAAIR